MAPHCGERPFNLSTYPFVTHKDPEVVLSYGFLTLETSATGLCGKLVLYKNWYCIRPGQILHTTHGAQQCPLIRSWQSSGGHHTGRKKDEARRKREKGRKGLTREKRKGCVLQARSKEKIMYQSRPRHEKFRNCEAKTKHVSTVITCLDVGFTFSDSPEKTCLWTWDSCRCPVIFADWHCACTLRLCSTAFSQIFLTSQMCPKFDGKNKLFKDIQRINTPKYSCWVFALLCCSNLQEVSILGAVFVFALLLRTSSAGLSSIWHTCAWRNKVKKAIEDPAAFMLVRLVEVGNEWEFNPYLNWTGSNRQIVLPNLSYHVLPLQCFQAPGISHN